MKYNTEQKALRLPVYGRNIQNMVDHCINIPDREERTICAKNIINFMGNMFPLLRDVNDFKHILWDHLAIMSEFKLDIDFPYEIITEEKINEKPEKIPYQNNYIPYRHYGNTIERLIEKTAELEPGERREALELLTANQMKKAYLQWNKDSVDDEKILKDLYELSKGKINIPPSSVKLMASKEIRSIIAATQQNSLGKKKNGKKNR